MATLKEAILYAKQNPNDPKSQKLKQAILIGKMDSVAQTEGLDLSGFKAKADPNQEIARTAAPSAVKFALQGAENALGKERVGQLMTDKSSALSKTERGDVDYMTNVAGVPRPEATQETLAARKEPGVAERSFLEKVKDIPSKAMEGAQEGELKKIEIQRKEEALKAKGEDFESRLAAIEITEDMPWPDKVAAWSAKNIAGPALQKLNELGVEALPYTEPLKAAIYEQFVDPAIGAALEAEWVPTGKPGDWIQSPKNIGKDIGTGIGAITPEVVKESLGDVGADLEAFVQENPDVALELQKTGATMEAIRPIIDILVTKGFIKGAKPFTKSAMAELEASGEVFQQASTIAAGKAKSTLSPIIESITKPRFVGKRNALAESMLNSAIKVDPVRGAEKFYKLSKGQTMGSFLMERDIIGTPEQVINDLSDRFSKVKGVFDDTVASIEGSYQFGAMDDVLTEMEERFIQTKGKELARVKALRAKYDVQGLTMAENLEMKRLYERKVKTGYLKDNNSLSIERATNLDNQLREEFVATAQESGFTNVKDLSREIQLTKAAMDSIESKTIRQLVNNQFSLTDNLLLVGGAINPSSLAVLGVKKIASSPSVQAKIIKALVTNDIKLMKAIPGIPSEVIAAKNAVKRQALFEQWLKETGLKDVMEGTEAKMLSAPESIQAQGASDALEVRGQQYREGTGLFEGQRSVKESITPSSKINKNSMPKTLPESTTKVKEGVKTTKAEVPASVAKEAKKFKSADEFAASLRKPEILKKNDLGDLKNKLSSRRQRYENAKKGTKYEKEFDVPKFEKDIPALEKKITEVEKAEAEWSKTIEIIKELEAAGVKTKSQLTDIWNKANKSSSGFSKAATPQTKLTSTAEKNILKSTKPNTMDTLAKEAKKYKTADEFVKAQPTAYHFTSPDTKITKWSTKKSQGRVWFTDNPNVGENVGASGRGKMYTVRFDKNAKWATPEQADKSFTDQLIADGYDGVYHPDSTGEYGNYYEVFNPKVIKTKSQLTDIWKQANKTPEASLISEAKKYKTADEFVKAQTPVYHGSQVELKQFSNKRGTFFTDDYMNAEGYAGGENVYEGYLNLEKPLVIDAKGRMYNDLKTEYGKSTIEVVSKVDTQKHDGVIFKNIKDSWIDDADVQDPSTIYYAFKPKESFLNESQLESIWKQANK